MGAGIRLTKLFLGRTIVVRNKKGGAAMTEKIVVFGGCFNPPTLAHLRLLLGAVDALGAEKGIFVPASGAYVERKMSVTAHPHEIYPEQARLEMLRIMASQDSRLYVENLEFTRNEAGFTYVTLQALSEKYPGAELWFLTGGDHIASLPHWYRAEELLTSFRFAVVGRSGVEAETVLQSQELLRRYRNRFFVFATPEGVDGISSSGLRDRLRRADASAESMCHAGVWNYLCSAGINFGL